MKISGSKNPSVLGHSAGTKSGASELSAGALAALYYEPLFECHLLKALNMSLFVREATAIAVGSVVLSISAS